MIDFGLVISIAIAFALPSLVAFRWRMRTCDAGDRFYDVALVPVAAGVVVGRFSTLLIDDPNSASSLADVLIVRSGVEFWPAVAAAAAVAGWLARRDGTGAGDRLSDLAALAIVGYAGFEAACVFRDGCFGPASPLGLRPPGIGTTMVPMGLFVGAALAILAIGIHRLDRSAVSKTTTISLAVLGVAFVRGLASFWLPHVGDGMTRQHQSSILVAAVAVIAATTSLARDRTKRTGSPVPTVCGE